MEEEKALPLTYSPSFTFLLFLSFLSFSSYFSLFFKDVICTYINISKEFTWNEAMKESFIFEESLGK